MSERRKHPEIMAKEANCEDRNTRKLPNVKAKYPELMERETNREEDGKKPEISEDGRQKHPGKR